MQRLSIQKSLRRNRCYSTMMTSFENLKFAGIQLNVTADKSTNLKNASDKIKEAVKHGAQIVSLPVDFNQIHHLSHPKQEMFNCPYSNDSFPVYSEVIGSGPSSEMLSLAAKENNIFLVGGNSCIREQSKPMSAGSIPERDPTTQKLYNTSLVYNPEGKLIAKHQKVHLFDIDIPGKMTFKESLTLTPGNSLTIFDTGITIVIPLKIQNLLVKRYLQSSSRNLL